MSSNTNFASYEKCCRTCLKEDPLMFDLFIERLESSNIVDVLVSYTKLKIQKNDSLPKQICRYCYNCLISFAHFSNMAQIAETKLKEALLNNDGFNQNNSESDCKIKVENVNHNDIFESNENLETTDSKRHIHNNNYKDDRAEKTKLNCLYCNKQFNKLAKLKLHEKNHLIINSNPLLKNSDSNDQNNCSNMVDLACTICSSKFVSYHLLTEHMRIHEDSDSRMHCDQCDKVFKNISHFETHKAICNQSDTIMSKENLNTHKCETKYQYQCHKCSLAFKNINSLSAHMRKHTERGRVISCEECNKVFKKLSHLKRHEIQHGKNCPFKCSLCPKSLATEEALKDHLNRHRGLKPHMCPICGKKFSHMSTLTTHIRLHTREQLFLCPTCGKRFDSSTNLNQHMLRHNGLKNYACTLCPKRFISKGELKSHEITHTGERPYKCDQCGATFTKRSSLTKHNIRHLGLKPHQCHICLRRFTTKSHLNRHSRIHTGEKPYRCAVCERAFTQSTDLVKHRRLHVGDKVYKCSQCTDSFRFNSELRKHISEHFVSSKNTPETNASDLQPIDVVTSNLMSALKPTEIDTNITQTNHSIDIK